MKNNEREMTQEARQNIVEAMNNPCKIYTAPGELCVSRLEYSILLRKAQRYDMLIAALIDNSYLDYCNDLDIKDPEQLLRIFESEKYKDRQRELIEEKEVKRRESEDR